jgi:hypothetical protein
MMNKWFWIVLSLVALSFLSGVIARLVWQRRHVGGAQVKATRPE